jgi:hypothetical protein
MSDDHSVWLRGERRIGELRRISKESSEHLELFTMYENYMFSGKAFEIPDKPKPGLCTCKKKLMHNCSGPLTDNCLEGKN